MWPGVLKGMGAALVLGLACLVPAHAADPEAGGLMIQSQPAVLDCLTPAAADRRPLEYPEEALKFKIAGLVRVGLEFRRPDRAPKVTFLSRSGYSSLDDAVEDYVSAYRLPCLRPETGSVEVEQEFSFSPFDGRPVVWVSPRAVGPDISSPACRPRTPQFPPSFPRQAMDHRVNAGVVVLRMQFRGPTEPPTQTILYQSEERSFGSEVERYARWIRLPCLKEEQSVSAVQVFSFRMDDAADYTLKDLGLGQFVSALDKLDQQHVQFDFNAMGCPFEVRLRLYQPAMENSVGEVEHSDPRRAEFLKWLGGVSLKLPRKALEQVLGDSMNITVPCTQLDLR